MKLMIQFHADVRELLCVINDVYESSRCSICIVKSSPFSLEILNGGFSLDSERAIENARTTGLTVVLSIRPYATQANTFWEFMRENDGCVVFDVGRLTSKGLEESAVSFMSEDAPAIDFAKQIQSKIKAITKAGVIAVNPDSGAESRLRNHRYTEEAKSLYKCGVRLLPVAGNAILRLEI
jgi:hypothetical protein